MLDRESDTDRLLALELISVSDRFGIYQEVWVYTRVDLIGTTVFVAGSGFFEQFDGLGLHRFLVPTSRPC